MQKQSDEGYCRKVANAAILVLISRISVPIIGALCMWIVSTVHDMEKNVTTLAAQLPAQIATVEAKIEGVDKRMGNIEDWRNQMDAFASEEKPQHRKN